MNMSDFKKKGYRNKNDRVKQETLGAQARETLEKINSDNIVIQNFAKYAKQLDAKWDKYERIVKFSRDITIESKRIIFLLHTIDREDKKISVLNEAEKRLEILLSTKFKQIAKELDGEDPYLYHKAYSPGIQEFIEAFIYFHYLKDEQIFFWSHYQNKLEYKVTNETNKCDGDTDKLVNEKKISTLLVPVDYILGLADATGELMRKCINNLGVGNVDECYEMCDFVRNLFSGFLTISSLGSREISHKSFTLKQSLLKMEMVCYNIKVRGSEVQKHMLADIDSYKAYVDDDN